MNGSVRRHREHDIGCVVDEGAAVRLGKAEGGRCADLIRQDVGAAAMRNILPVCPRILRGSVGGDNSGYGLSDGCSVSCEVISWASGIEAVAEIFVVLG